MSVVKRILEANNFSKHLPDSWKSNLLPNAVAVVQVDEVSVFTFIKPEIITVPLTKKHQLKQTDKNQLSLF